MPVFSSVGLSPASHSSSSSTLRVGGQRAGQFDPLLVDVGQGGDGGARRGAPARPARAAHRAMRRGPRAPQQPPVAEDGAGHDVLEHGIEAGQHAHQLEGARDAARARSRCARQAGDRAAVEQDRRPRWAPARRRSRLSMVVLPEPFGPIRPRHLVLGCTSKAEVVDRDAGRRNALRAPRTLTGEPPSCGSSRPRARVAPACARAARLLEPPDDAVAAGSRR